MDAIILYKTNHCHSYASRDLIGIFTSRKTLHKCIKKIIKDNQWDNPRELDTKEELKNYIQYNINFFIEKGQTQGLNDFELDSEMIVLNQLIWLMEQTNKFARYKTETLLKRLQVYDNKYNEAITKPRREQTWGYAMRAYHAAKVANPPEWIIRDKAALLVEELKTRGVKYSTVFLKL